MILAGRSVLITGGGTGVGAAMARAFAAEGASVIVAGRRAAPLEALAAEHGAIRAIPADVTDEDAVAALFAAAGPVEIVIANAGAAETAPFARTTRATWERMLAVNLTGTFLTLRAGLGQMAGWGRLISVASTAGLRGYAYASAYTAAKHGVVGLTRALAQEVARSDVTANALCPGFLDTAMTEHSVATIAERTGMTSDEARSRLAGHNPQGRLIAPTEVAAAALWLCRPGAEGVNGQAIAIAGGEI